MGIGTHAVTTKPQPPILLLDGVGILKNGSKVGPFKEGTEISLRCESRGGKPVPKVSWLNGTSQIYGSKQWMLLSGLNSITALDMNFLLDAASLASPPGGTDGSLHICDAVHLAFRRGKSVVWGNFALLVARRLEYRSLASLVPLGQV
ncbi:unnamed protein product [Notodromas monacha]|uniref:Ig-like domain-containing protein n=1 Tax=Notodromas monacha TaxID=399045 RepID=A0A7R9BK67_9CRUS|nr:unnamed protein product [Notodromas monacha]CAG0915650.1 unnamed protein product [Notodromas monacha]